MRKPKKESEKYKQGQWIGIGIALGVVFGAVVDNIGLGISLGLVIGVAVDYYTKRKFEKEQNTSDGKDNNSFDSK